MLQTVWIEAKSMQKLHNACLETASLTALYVDTLWVQRGLLEQLFCFFVCVGEVAHSLTFFQPKKKSSNIRLQSIVAATLHEKSVSSMALTKALTMNFEKFEARLIDEKNQTDPMPQIQNG